MPLLSEDYEAHWPNASERILGPKNFAALNESCPGNWLCARPPSVRQTASPSTVSETIVVVGNEERQGSIRRSWAPHLAAGVGFVRLDVHPCMCL